MIISCDFSPKMYNHAHHWHLHKYSSEASWFIFSLSLVTLSGLSWVFFSSKEWLPSATDSIEFLYCFIQDEVFQLFMVDILFLLIRDLLNLSSGSPTEVCIRSTAVNCKLSMFLSNTLQYLPSTTCRLLTSCCCKEP